MDDQEDLDVINDKLYSLTVPEEDIKKLMFYFSVLNEAIDFEFPKNYLNYDHPFFKAYSDMEFFLSLARTLNPDLLYQNNVIIYYNKKEFYKYYQLNDDQNGIPYEFKLVNNSESTNPIFDDNYKNSFNIFNINKNQTEFDVNIQNKTDFLYSDDSDFDEIEENYTIEEINHEKSTYHDSINELSEDDEQLTPYFNYIKNNYNENEIEKNILKSHESYAYKNQIESNDENDSNQFDEEQTKIHAQKVEIKHKLVVTKDWINYIYTEPMRKLCPNIKAVVKGKDVIRTKSISLPRNIFFYLEILSLALLICCSSTLLSWTSTLLKDHKFLLYGGINITNEDNNMNKNKNGKFQFFSNEKKGDPSNDIIVPNIKKYKKINKGCQLCEASSIFGIFFFVFVIYMCIRVAREKKRKYQKKENKKKVGLNMCHIFLLIFLTITAVVISFVAEIFIIIAIVQHSYLFIHVYVRTQLILNSLVLLSYILIFIFYCKI